MIIWSGLGILVPIIGGVCYWVMQNIVGESTMDTHGWPKTIAFFVAAAFVTLLGVLLNKQPGRVMIDRATGQEVTLRRRHSVFFIPVLYWGLIYAAVGIYCMFTH